ncbi:MAG: hypothetical protein GXO77_03005 [Calditrichaeota bacterium]|nr:hypothetical protein [Calditrichota bacterium]
MKQFLSISALISLLLLCQLKSQSVAEPDTVFPGKQTQTADSIQPALKIPPIESYRALLNEHGNQFDSLSNPVYDFDDLLYLNYNGLADVFRVQPDVQVFDFLDMGMPRFVSDLHLFPQQTPVYWNDFLLNDPTNGMYNTRFLYPDALQWAEIPEGSAESAILKTTNNQSAILFYSRQLFPQKPYTRIMYREGDFGYTDLDITFAQKINPETIVQLGGINRDYTPNYYRGNHYRGTITRRLSDRLLMQAFYRKSGENVDFPNAYREDFGRFRYNEVREDIFTHLIHFNENAKADWQLRAGFSDSRRKYRLSDTRERYRIRFDRYFVQGIKDWQAGKFAFRTLLNAGHTKSWGSVYYRKYDDTELNLQTMGAFSLADSLKFTFKLNLNYFWNQPYQADPSFSFNWKNKIFSANLDLEKYSRFPTVHERFFNFKGISGNRNLNAERHFVSRASFSVNPLSWNRNRFSLIYHRIKDEIVFTGTTFYAGPKRDFAVAMVQSTLKLFKFKFRLGAQLGLAGDLIGAEQSVLARGMYHDRWLKGRLIIDAAGTIQWYGSQKNIAYQPYAERFYKAGGKSDGYYLLSYKIVATVKDARFFMEMDNPLGLRYHIIQGYPEFYRRVRFGLSWVLWD